MSMGARFLIFLLLAAAASASDDKVDRATLKGVNRACVVVEVTDQAARGGVDKAKLQAEIETRLSKAGVTVDNGATTCLYLSVRALQAMAGSGKHIPLYAADVRLEFVQTLLLARDNAVKTFAPTWSASNMTTVAADELGSTATEITIDLMNHFVKAFKSVNPWDS